MYEKTNCVLIFCFNRVCTPGTGDTERMCDGRGKGCKGSGTSCEGKDCADGETLYNRYRAHVSDEGRCEECVTRLFR